MIDGNEFILYTNILVIRRNFEYEFKESCCEITLTIRDLQKKQTVIEEKLAREKVKWQIIQVADTCQTGYLLFRRRIKNKVIISL